MNGDVIRTITIRGTSEGLDKLQTDLTKLAAAHKNVAIAAEETDKKTLSLEQAWKRQTLRLDEAARAQANIARETKLADAALKEGVATQAQHAQRLEQINQRYATATTATKTFGQQTGLARHELVNLSRQVQDVGVSLASGQSPLSVLVQQGSQIADVFATSGGTLRGFFSQAIGWAGRFLASTTGIVTAVGAVGAAAIYAALQFRTASTTIEQALEEQKRLIKEATTLIDAKATVEQRANAQSADTTRFLALQNEIDLYVKLQAEIEKTIRTSEQRAGTPTQVAGEMGQAPTGIGPFGGSSSGYGQIVAAVQDLKVATDQGLPGLQAYQNALGQIGLAHPEIAVTVSEMIRASQASVGLEQAALKAKALSDGMAGIATNAQLAAAGLGSIAEFGVRMDAVAAAGYRLANSLREIQAAHPGISMEVAKQLQLLDAQLKVAQARGEQEKIIAQELARQLQLQQQNLTEAEAALIAAKERAIAEEGIAERLQQQAESQSMILPPARDLQNTTHGIGDEISRNITLTNQLGSAIGGIVWTKSLVEGDLYDNVFGGERGSTGDVQTSIFPTPNLWKGINIAKRLQFTDSGRGQAMRDELEKWAADVHNPNSELNSSLKDLTASTDSLNDTMQNALSPYYSQDPRTTKLGFRAGVVGNPDWQTGATNANPLVAVLGAGATAPGMADGGSFTVGGGYSATDNRMAVFPVASGEQIVVNRNREGRAGTGGQVVNIDNRIIVQGNIDENTLSKMKVSRFQQAQRMRAGMAQAS